MKVQNHFPANVILLSVLIFSEIIYCQSTAISLKAGSLGCGFETIHSITGSLNGRIGINYFSYPYDGKNQSGDINYDLNFNMLSISAFVDWFPFQNDLHLSGGLLYNGNNIDGTGKPTRTYVIGANTYTPEKLGYLDAEIEPELKISPYLGVGWGNAIKPGKKLGFTINAGMIYQGSPDVTLTSTGLMEPTAEQEPDVEDDIRNLKFYPVLTFGLTYQF